MGFLDWLFRKKAAVPAPDPTVEEEEIQPAGAYRVHGPPEFLRAVELQRAYWAHNPEEQARLERRGMEKLGWPERLRLHHLVCLERLNPGPERAAAKEKCRQTVRRLLASDSPYRPRPAMVWQGQLLQSESSRVPDLQGEFLNPSLTHIGCLEICRVDAANQPTGIDFVSFEVLAAVVFARPSLLRAAKLLYDDGRDEVVLVPMLYGLTWAVGNEYDREGRMTRFVGRLEGEELGVLGATGLGVGQQDFTIRNPDGTASWFGIMSVAAISFPPDLRDPRFD